MSDDLEKVATGEIDLHIVVTPATEVEHLEPAAITVDTVAVPITLVHEDGEEVEAMAPPVAAIEHPAQPSVAHAANTGSVPRVLPKRRTATAWAHDLGVWLPLASGALIAALGLGGGALLGAAIARGHF